MTEAENDAGQSLDRNELFEWARETAIDSSEAFGQSVLQRLEFFQRSRRNDDQTMIVLQREPESVPASLGKAAADRWMPAQDQPDAERAVNELIRGQ